MNKELDWILSWTPEEISRLFYNLFNDKEKRLAMVRRSTFLFAFYYLNKTFKSPIAPFHKEMSQALDNDYIQNILMIMFRWSWKTTYIKADFLKQVCFWLRKVMVWASADWSSDNLYDIARQLQTNPRILSDFWSLYFPDKKQESLRSSKKTSVWNFQTANWVRVFSVWVLWSLRWLQNLEEAVRVDYLIMDDIENSKTVRRPSIVKATKNFIDEAIWGLSPNYKMIILWNRISNNWAITFAEKKFENSKNSVIIDIPAIVNWKPTWPWRYVMTDFERELLWPWVHEVYSLEKIKRDLNTDWRRMFEQEYMNIPFVSWNLFFDDEIEQIDATIQNRKDNQIVKKVWKWTIFKSLESIKWQWLCRYLLGIDVAAGYWLDSSSIYVINLDTTEQVAVFCDNFASPNQLVNEIIWAHKKYNKAKIVPERNSLWIAVVEWLKKEWYAWYMTKQRTIDSVTNKTIDKYWWVTTSSSKPKMLFDFKRDFAEWNIIINDIHLLNEMKNYTNDEIDYTWHDPDASNHFDRLMAACIANANKRVWAWFYVQKNDLSDFLN